MPKPGSTWTKMQRCDRDGYQLVMQGLATVVRVAQSEELKYALPAGQWLVTYGEELMREKKAAQRPQQLQAPSTREQVINELRGLYAKALGSAPLVVEAQPVPEPSE